MFNMTHTFWRGRMGSGSFDEGGFGFILWYVELFIGV